MAEKPIRVTVSGQHGGYIIEHGQVKEWWGTSPPWCLFVGDYSQLEIRLLAHVSGDQVLCDAILAGEDVHALTAQAVYDHIPKDISLAEVKTRFPKERKDAKPINFGVIYGMGPQALAATLGITEEAADEIINIRYMAKYPGVKAFIAKMHAMAKKYGYVTTAIGRKRHLPAAQLDTRASRDNKRYVSQACRQGQNAPIQGFAADVVGLAMRDIRRHFKATTPGDIMSSYLDPKVGRDVLDKRLPMWGNSMRKLLQVHDELVMEAHPAVANYMLEKSKELMEDAVKLKVPIIVDAALGVDWHSTKE